jgi:carboxymethylenebutenolidase
MDARKLWRLNWIPVALLIVACDPGTTSSGDSSTDSEPAAPAAPATTTAPATPPAEESGKLREVVAESLAYAEVGEQLVHGHFAFPADMVDPLPGIIVIHERWGLDEGTRQLADRLAGNGYIVLAVDLFGGRTATDVATARTLMVGVVENPDLANDNIRQAYDFLRNSALSPTIAAVGWSFGGNWALNTALLYPNDLGAAVVYYGQLPSNEERLAPLNVPVLGLFGENDRGVTVETVREFEGVMESLGKEFRIEVYPGVGHAFADPTGSNYNPGVADRAWQEVIAFLETNLKVGE